MFQLSDLIILALIALVAFCWWHNQGVRQLVLRACQQHCSGKNLLLLDESVSLHRLWFKRDERGRFRSWRSYDFEFASTGSDRYKGRAVTLGDRVLDISLEPYRVSGLGAE
jgi:hypothetical protein